jgi:hypothetical protein
MSNGVLEVLKYFFLAVLWLFFIYAARMVLVDARRDGRANSPLTEHREVEERRDPVKLRVIEGPYRGETIELAKELTFGRSGSCDVSLEGDTYASSVHARVFVRDGEVIVEDLGSTNGTMVNHELAEGPVIVDRGDVIQIGSTVVEVRR